MVKTRAAARKECVHRDLANVHKRGFMLGPPLTAAQNSNGSMLGAITLELILKYRP